MTADDLSAEKRATMSPLRWERVRRGLTLREAADGADLTSHSQLAHWEDGTWQMTNANRAMLARFYGTTVEDLFREEAHDGETLGCAGVLESVAESRLSR